MSKKIDRLNSIYRNCPRCGRKTVYVTLKGKFKKNMIINCYGCRGKFLVKEVKYYK